MTKGHSQAIADWAKRRDGLDWQMAQCSNQPVEKVSCETTNPANDKDK